MKTLSLSFDRTLLMGFLDKVKTSEALVVELTKELTYAKIHPQNRAWIKYASSPTAHIITGGEITDKIYIPLLSTSKLLSIVAIMAMRKEEVGKLTIHYSEEENTFSNEAGNINVANYLSITFGGSTIKVVCPEPITVTCVMDSVWDKLKDTTGSILSFQMEPDYISYLTKLSQLDPESFIHIESDGESSLSFRSLDGSSYNVDFEGNVSAGTGGKVNALISKENFLGNLGAYKDMVDVHIMAGKVVSSCDGSYLINSTSDKT